MHIIAEFLMAVVVSTILSIVEWTARIFLRTVSFGWIRIQGSPTPYEAEPVFGWHNVVWKWDGKALWLPDPFALYFGLFLWCGALTALVYYWHA